MKPSTKSPGMEAFLEAAMGRTTAITGDVCAFCKEDAKEFKDNLSRKEYTISGLCQTCQDKTFGSEDD